MSGGVGGRAGPRRISWAGSLNDSNRWKILDGEIWLYGHQEGIVDDYYSSRRIPEYLQACAIILGGEKAWGREDALVFIQWLSENQQAVDGIEVWVRSASTFPEIPSPYIYTWTVDDQAEGEAWPDFVERSCNAASNYVRGFAWDERDRSYRVREPLFNLSVASRD